jgi:hypothetical protein
MKFEIDLAREQHRVYFIPTRTKPDEPPVSPDEVVARRRSLRLTTDELIHKAMLNGDIVTLLQCLVETMTATAGTCAQFGLEPDISDFMLAGKDLIEDARVLLDKALLVRDYEQVKIGAAMIQCVVAGICAVCGLPYREAFELAHQAYIDAGSPTREQFVKLLREHGFEVKAEAANDGDAA